MAPNTAEPEALSGISLFRGVPTRELERLAPLMHERNCEETPEGVRIPIRPTQADLGASVGASRVRVNQALGHFRKRGSISLDNEGRITVRD